MSSDRKEPVSVKAVAIRSVTAAVLAALSALASPAHAVPLVFTCIAAGNSANCAVGEAQLIVEVVDSGPGHAAFIFSNEGEARSSIARIYVADERGTLAGPPEIHQDAPAVLFENGVSPPKLPGGASLDPAFAAVPTLGVMAANPDQERGINPGEHVGLVFPISPGNTFADVLADLSIGNLRLGVHVVGFTSKGNESFVSQLVLTETLE